MGGGNKQKTESETNISNDINISISNIITNEISNSTNCDTNVNQDGEITVGDCASFECEDINISNSTKVLLSCLQESKTEISVNLSNEVASAISDTITSQMDVMQDNQTGINNSQHTSNKTNVKNTVDEEIKNEIKTVIENSINSNINVNSNDNIVFNGTMKGDDCNLSNETIVESIVSQITESTMDLVSSNAAINDIIGQYNMSTSATQKGFDFNQMFSDWFEGFFGFLDNWSPGGFLEKALPIIIAIVIGVVVFILAYVLFSKFFKGKQEEELTNIELGLDGGEGEGEGNKSSVKKNNNYDDYDDYDY
jgi:hypothetical protein